jgi:uncharacterized protein (DUF1778 family)
MRSLRLDSELDEKVRRAAAVKGESVSEFLRHAAAERAEETLSARPSERFADVTGDAFAASLAEDRERQ